MNSKILVASVQMVSSNIWRDNLSNAKKLIRNAAINGARVVVIPEFFILIATSGSSCRDEVAEDLGNGYIQQELSNTAKENNVFLVAGSLLIKSPVVNRFYNTCIVYSPDGNMLCHYHKIHLFKFDDGTLHMDESETFTHGSNIVTFIADGFKFGLSICYDLRFPELFRHMKHVDAIILPAAFTYFTGKPHWEVLLRARAIENQCYVIAANQGGLHNCGRHTFGHSMIIDYWGEIVNCLHTGEGIVFGIIDKEKMLQARVSLPALEHRSL